MFLLGDIEKRKKEREGELGLLGEREKGRKGSERGSGAYLERKGTRQGSKEWSYTRGGKRVKNLKASQFLQLLHCGSLIFCISEFHDGA